MIEEPLPSDVRELLDASIESIEALDALLLLQGDASRWWAIAEVAGAIDVEATTARQALANLKSRGLATEAAGGALFRVATLTPLSFRALGLLKSACSVHRTAVADYMARRSLGRLRCWRRHSRGVAREVGRAPHHGATPSCALTSGAGETDGSATAVAALVST